MHSTIREMIKNNRYKKFTVTILKCIAKNKYKELNI